MECHLLCLFIDALHFACSPLRGHYLYIRVCYVHIRRIWSKLLGNGGFNAIRISAIFSCKFKIKCVWRYAKGRMCFFPSNWCSVSYAFCINCAMHFYTQLLSFLAWFGQKALFLSSPFKCKKRDVYSLMKFWALYLLQIFLRINSQNTLFFTYNTVLESFKVILK